MDFKEDQLAIEAYVRMKCGWRDDDEISHEEFVTYAFEYMEENPFADDKAIENYIIRCIAKTDRTSEARLYKLYEYGELTSENEANLTE